LFLPNGRLFFVPHPPGCGSSSILFFKTSQGIRVLNSFPSWPKGCVFLSPLGTGSPSFWFPTCFALPEGGGGFTVGRSSLSGKGDSEFFFLSYLQKTIDEVSPSSGAFETAPP